MGATLQREHWNGQPTYLGDLFRVSKMRDEKTLAAVCKLWTPQLVPRIQTPAAVEPQARLSDEQ
jgi:hypothetical protein